MSEKTGCGLMAMLVLLFIVVLIGAPMLDASGLRWDNSGRLADIRSRERVELARLANQDADSARWNQTVQLATQVIVWAAVILGSVFLTTVTLSRFFGTYERVTERRIAAQERLYLEMLTRAKPYLAQRPGARLEIVDGEWGVVDDSRGEIVLLRN